MKVKFKAILAVVVLCIAVLSLAGCIPGAEPEKTEEEKMVKAFINDLIDEKYEEIKNTYVFADSYVFDAQKQGAILKGFYEKYGEKSAISQVLKAKDTADETYYRELLLDDGKIWLNVTLNEANQIVDFSITDKGVYEN